MAIKIYDNGGKTADRYTAINTKRPMRGQPGVVFPRDALGNGGGRLAREPQF